MYKWFESLGYINTMAGLHSWEKELTEQIKNQEYTNRSKAQKKLAKIQQARLNMYRRRKSYRGGE